MQWRVLSDGQKNSNKCVLICQFWVTQIPAEFPAAMHHLSKIIPNKYKPLLNLTKALNSHIAFKWHTEQKLSSALFEQRGIVGISCFKESESTRGHIFLFDLFWDYKRCSTIINFDTCSLELSVTSSWLQMCWLFWISTWAFVFYESLGFSQIHKKQVGYISGNNFGRIVSL